jgi:putative hydrolase of the HAD superfamily
LSERAQRGKETPVSPFDVILFDVGGVLLTNGWDRRERAAAVAQFKLDAQELEARHVEVFEAWERGEISLDQYLDRAVFYEPRSFSRGEFFDFMLTQSQLLPDGAMPILKELSARSESADDGMGDCMIGALNNEARETNDFRFGKFDLRRYFKVAFSSCYVGLRKPEPAMYRRALDILGRPAQRVLFIDDREENVAGGAAAGMTAIRFTGEVELRKELERLGVV